MTDPGLLDIEIPLDRFRRHLLADPGLQRQLSAFDDPADFVPVAVAAAAGAGIVLSEDELLDTMRPDPLGIARYSNAPATHLEPPAGDWLPVAIVSAGAELGLDWAHFAGRPLRESFFEDSLRQARALPLNRMLKVRTPLSALAAAVGDDLPVPDGFIFHLSRCGSTLVSQMLAADPRNIVLSEAIPIESAVQLAQSNPGVPIEERVRLLRAIVGALGRDRTGSRRHFVVKLDSWHVFALPLFRLAFPDTPWVFLYRDPIEILVSHARMAGMQTVVGVLPHDPYGIPDGETMPLEEYSARALGLTAAAAVEHFDLGGGIVINYAALPQAVEDRILPHFGIVPDAEERAAMAAAAGRDAKSPLKAFRSDGEEKRRDASPRIRDAAVHLAEPYRRLEALRLAHEK
ncbi:hypothetical protein U1769_19220 [Sphingomonas sp. ZT3P38]|uniref:hypothetical protein n=1 Tax=Parasphingomonas zepuensis TaxID=3096161 RepID=UPI002FCC84B2